LSFWRFLKKTGPTPEHKKIKKRCNWSSQRKEEGGQKRKMEEAKGLRSRNYCLGTEVQGGFMASRVGRGMT